MTFDLNKKNLYLCRPIMNYAGAGLIVLSSDGSHVLLVHDARSAKWGFPKGHRETVDASDLITATRECWEETGLTTDDYTICPEVFKISKGSQSYLFRYAILKGDMYRTQLRHGPAHEISGLMWVSIQQLLNVADMLDGNKYLRTWITDLQGNAPKKSVYLFKSLSARLFPLQKPMSSCNVVTCA